MSEETRAPARRAGVWELAWPSMALFALHALVGVVDFAFVSSLGTSAIAGVGVATQIHFMIFALLSAVTTGTVAVISRASGSGNWIEVGQATRCSIALSSLFGAAGMLVVPFGREFVAVLGVAPEVAELGGSCLSILLLFNLPFAVGIALEMALRGAGDMRTPLTVGIVANLINVVLDYALIFGELGAPELGAVGSAWASGISFIIGMALLWGLWIRGRLIIAAGRWRGSLTRAMTQRLIRIGLPAALEQSAFQFGLLIFMSVVSRYGTEPVSAYLIGVRILALCFVPGFGFAQAAATLVGQNLGAGRPDLAARAGWRGMFGAVGVMGSVGLTIVLFARPLVGIFGAVGDETIGMAVTFIYILGAAQPLMAIEFSLSGGLRGAGDTRFPLFVILAGLFAVRLGGAWLVAIPIFGTVTAVWSCLLADYALKSSLLVWRFGSGTWKKMEV